MRTTTSMILAAILGSTAASGAEYTIAPGPFQPSWESLASQYKTPDWFRDAKFGIWAHWSAQCVPEQGDWYARNMYIQGSRQYLYHLEHYGHPSRFGFKDIDNVWRAEKWEPEKMMALYKAAGAKYFVALANHHDNLDCYDSRHQPWNSVVIGPRKDIVGIWSRVARKAGLRFGVSVHAAHTWSWFEKSQNSDTNGPFAGVPYDGRLTKADGKGLWWEGLDPQDLYEQNHKPGPRMDWDWDPAKGSTIPDEAYRRKFFLRTQQLIDDYTPDFVYYDDSILPLHFDPSVGLNLIAHQYNSSLLRHGRNEAVVTTKQLKLEEQRRSVVWDIERGKSDRIEPFPWQTCTCIGEWHYNRNVFTEHRYKNAAAVIPMLVDIVSKNGNLLLSIPVRGDGSLDEDEIAFLQDLAGWMKVNGECLFGTRPWRKFGGARDTRTQPFTAEDIRFTTKDGAVYAIALGWPTNGQLVIKSLGTEANLLDGSIARVELLDGKTPAPAQRGAEALMTRPSRTSLKWTRTAEALVVQLPATKPCDWAYAIRITRK
jgi:alpha-L-fucosidase